MTPEQIGAAVRVLFETDPALSASEVRARLKFPVTLRRVQQILRELRETLSVLRRELGQSQHHEHKTHRARVSSLDA